MTFRRTTTRQILHNRIEVTANGFFVYAGDPDKLSFAALPDLVERLFPETSTRKKIKTKERERKRERKKKNKGKIEGKVERRIESENRNKAGTEVARERKKERERERERERHGHATQEIVPSSLSLTHTLSLSSLSLSSSLFQLCLPPCILCSVVLLFIWFVFGFAAVFVFILNLLNFCSFLLSLSLSLSLSLACTPPCILCSVLLFFILGLRLFLSFYFNLPQFFFSLSLSLSLSLLLAGDRLYDEAVADLVRTALAGNCCPLLLIDWSM